MTALCGGGPSGPKSGVGGVLTLGAAAIEVFISSVLGLGELAPILAPIIAGLVDIDLALYCSTDPPADPGLTAGDIASAIEFPASVATFTAQQKILTWFEHQYWYTICQCTSTTTPGPAAPSNPGQVSSNPGLPSQPSPCWSVQVPYSAPAATTITNAVSVDMTPFTLPAGVVTPTSWGPGLVPGLTANAVTLPPGVTNVGLAATINEAFTSGHGGELLISYQGFTSTGTFSPGDAIAVAWNINGPFGGRTAGSVPTVPSTTTHTAVSVQNSDNVIHTGMISLSFFCPAGVNLGPPCCPPDPILEGELQQILQYVQAIYADLAPPSSFAEATVHSGLSGAGSITFVDLPIAVRVVLTTVPSWVGLQVGNPDFYFDVGYITFSTSEGNYASTRISFVYQVITVPVLSGSLGYTLENGVVASITELVPGP